jgi:glucose-1-phosphate adenylyltransferase
MNDVMGVIYTGGADASMGELTTTRAVAALPVAGRYRMIDFQLSSLVNSGVRNVGVIMQRNYHSLMDHLGSGKEWDLHTRNDGLFILPPFHTRENIGTYEGELDALRSNLGYLRRSRQEYVVIMGNYNVFNLKFDGMIRQHVDSGADITLMYAKNYLDSRISPMMQKQHVYLDVADDHAIRDIEVGPNIPTHPNISMDVIVIRRKLLIHLVDQSISHGMHAIVGDMIVDYLRHKSINVMGYEYTGYVRRVESVLSYYRFNMDMLDHDVRQELLLKNPVYTKVRDEVPAKYMSASSVKHSLVADGCIIEGTVENSVLFRGVRVRRGAVVRNAVIMQGAEIQEEVEADTVILDKNVTLRSGRLIGQSAYPIVIGKDITL